MRELAAEFGINRLKVSTHLRRTKVAIRRGGLDQEQAVEAAGLVFTTYAQRTVAIVDSEGRMAEYVEG